MRKLVVLALKRAVLGPPPDPRDPRGPRPVRRLIDRVSGIVFPTNASGNNMSVR